MSLTIRRILIILAAVAIGFSAGYYARTLKTSRAPGGPASTPIYGIDTDTLSGAAYLPIYGIDLYTVKEQINFYVHIPDTLSLNDRMRLLADRISRLVFRGLPIEILSITEREGKRIARINLGEDSCFRSKALYNTSYSWYSGYFQGSTGGYETEVTLRKSFLQRDLKGEWIDGIEFYYEGEPMKGDNDWDHVHLDGVILRNK